MHNVLGVIAFGLAVGACARSTPSTEGAEAALPPEPASAPEPEPEPEPEPAPEPELLPPGPVINEASLAAHARAQGKMLRRGESLPPLRSVTEVATAESIAAEPTDPIDGATTGGATGAEARPPLPSLDDPSLSDAKSSDAKSSDAKPSDATPTKSTDASSESLLSDEDQPPPPMPGAFVAITDPKQGEALASFHAALQALQAGEDPDGKVRVTMYGASGTAADLAVGYVRTYLQARFGDGGPGFVPLVPLSRWYRHNEVKVEASKGWRKEHAQIRKGRLDGHYGLLGASFTATASKRWAKVRPKKKSFSCEQLAFAELYFLRQPGGGSFRVSIDDGPSTKVSTAADDFGPGYHTLQMEPGPHSIRIETVDEAEVRVFGVVLERPDPGVVVDVLGIDGTRGRNHLTWNESLWLDNVQRRAPDLYTLSYGTNESVDDDLSITAYAEDLRTQLRRFAQALPDASCLLLGPVDFPIREGDQILPRPLLQQIIEVQRQVAAEEGCGFWDGIAFMGGELSMPTWVNSEPALARQDHLHFTRWGAARKGMALADALMYMFDARGMGLARHPDEPG